MAPGPDPRGRAGAQQRPAHSFPFGSRREPFPLPPLRPASAPRPAPNPGPALNFQWAGATAVPPSSRARSFIPFSSSGKSTVHSWATWGKHPRSPKPATPTQQVASLPGTRGAAPLAHPPSSSNFIPIKLTAKLALGGGGGAFGGHAPRRLSALSSSDRVARGSLWARRSAWCRGPGVPGPPLAARAPRSQAGRRGVDPSARGHARERRRSFLQLRNSSRLSLAAGL